MNNRRHYVQRMPAQNLVMNEDEEREWTIEEQHLIEEKLLANGNNLATVFKLVGLLNERTIQQITTRVKWTLLPPEEKIPYEIFRNSQMKTDTQLVTSNSTNMIEIKKKKPRQRHSSVIEETQTQKSHKQRRLSMSREEKMIATMKTGLTVEYQPQISEGNSYNSLQGSSIASPRMTSISPNNGNMSFDCSSISNDFQQIDINQINRVIMENEQYLQMIQTSFMSNIPIQPDVFLSFQNNLNILMTVSQQMTYPLPLPFFSMNLFLPPQLQGIGMKDTIQTKSQLNWNIPF